MKYKNGRDIKVEVPQDEKSQKIEQFMAMDGYSDYIIIARKGDEVECAWHDSDEELSARLTEAVITAMNESGELGTIFFMAFATLLAYDEKRIKPFLSTVKDIKHAFKMGFIKKHDD